MIHLQVSTVVCFYGRIQLSRHCAVESPLQNVCDFDVTSKERSDWSDPLSDDHACGLHPIYFILELIHNHHDEHHEH